MHLLAEFRHDYPDSPLALACLGDHDNALALLHASIGAHYGALPRLPGGQDPASDCLSVSAWTSSARSQANASFRSAEASLAIVAP